VLGLAASAAASRAAVDVVGPVQIDEDGIGTGSDDLEDVDVDALARRVRIAFEGSPNGVPPRCVFVPQSVLLRTAFLKLVSFSQVSWKARFKRGK
jgi:hypothetical protein